MFLFLAFSNFLFYRRKNIHEVLLMANILHQPRAFLLDRFSGYMSKARLKFVFKGFGQKKKKMKNLGRPRLE
jgi:hypothetical protein